MNNNILLLTVIVELGIMLACYNSIDFNNKMYRNCK